MKKNSDSPEELYQEHEKTIQEEVEEDEELKQIIHESRKDYREGRYVTTSEFIESVYNKDFFKWSMWQERVFLYNYM